MQINNVRNRTVQIKTTADCPKFQVVEGYYVADLDHQRGHLHGKRPTAESWDTRQCSGSCLVQVQSGGLCTCECMLHQLVNLTMTLVTT